MTGEITLRGRVLPIGGLKEKALAADREGLKTVLFPDGNVKDLGEIPAEVRERVKLIPVKHFREVAAFALGPAAAAPPDAKPAWLASGAAAPSPPPPPQ
jgi:ATP-dependent Lon protease